MRRRQAKEIPSVNNEDYRARPDFAIEKVLENREWRRLGSGLWSKKRSRLLVDNTGVFLFRLLAGYWVRTAGLTHDRILLKHLRQGTIYFGDFEINL